MTPAQEQVTVVIPTRNRPELVTRAVASALAQSYPHLEVIVVVDGPDPDTVDRLNAIADSRLRVLALETNVGAGNARNLGVRHATGSWIAFLDDDDQWMPAKIAMQMAARPGDLRYPIMSCRCKVVTARGVFVWPRRLARAGDPIADYLFVRHGPFKGETFAPTSTLLAPRPLLLRHPIPVSLFDDWQWLIGCGQVQSCALVTVPDVLAVHHTESDRITLSTCHDIDDALRWAQSMRPKLTPRAYAGLLLQAIGGEPAARTGTMRRRILAAALRNGSPTAMALATFAMHSLLPVGLRRRLRQALFAEPGTAKA